MLSLAERAKMATEVRQRKAQTRAASVRTMLAEGECLKRAAWRAGVGYRTAKRYVGSSA